MFRVFGIFTVKGGISRRRYWIGRVWVRSGSPLTREFHLYCLKVYDGRSYPLPDYDQMLAKKLLLRGAEDIFLAIANWR